MDSKPGFNYTAQKAGKEVFKAQLKSQKTESHYIDNVLTNSSHILFPALTVIAVGQTKACHTLNEKSLVQQGLNESKTVCGGLCLTEVDQLIDFY